MNFARPLCCVKNYYGTWQYYKLPHSARIVPMYLPPSEWGIRTSWHYLQLSECPYWYKNHQTLNGWFWQLPHKKNEHRQMNTHVHVDVRVRYLYMANVRNQLRSYFRLFILSGWLRNYFAFGFLTISTKWRRNHSRSGSSTNRSPKTRSDSCAHSRTMLFFTKPSFGLTINTPCDGNISIHSSTAGKENVTLLT